jgi:hypothetical protein
LSPYLGKIDETFRINVEASAELLDLKVQGVVVGPTFTVSVPEIDFGSVAYGFVHSKFATIINTSSVCYPLPLDSYNSVIHPSCFQDDYLLSMFFDMIFESDNISIRLFVH